MKAGYPTILKCGECGSLNVARMARENGRLVCLACGHKGPPIHVSRESTGAESWSGSTEEVREF